MFTSMVSFPGSVFGDLERLRREFDEFFQTAASPASIRSVAPGSFPPVNVGHTPTSVEVYAFAPGLDAAGIDVTIDRGVLSIAGERKLPEPPAGTNVYGRERTGGRFRRAVSLPDDVDPARVEASYRDGVLRVSVARRESSQPRRIAVQ